MEGDILWNTRVEKITCTEYLILVNIVDRLIETIDSLVHTEGA